MQSVEPVVVGEHDVRTVVQQQGEHVVSLLTDGVVQRSVALAVLEGRVAAQTQEHFYDTNMTFIYGDMERCLSSFVPGVQIRPGCSDYLHHPRLVTEGSVMDGSVSVLILQLQVSSRPQ